MHRFVYVLALFCAPLLAPRALAQDVDEATRLRARRIMEEAQAHEEAERHALAGERFLDLYGVMSEAGLARAPVALWSAGYNLARVPGRGQEASETLRRFLVESAPLSQDQEVAGYRAEAATLIAELDARRAADPSADLQDPSGDGAAGEAGAGSGGGVSPVGPVVLAVGGAVLVAGLITVGVAFAQDQDLRSRCPSQVGCDPAMADEVDATRALGIAGDVLWIVGAAAAVAGLVLTLTLEDGGDGDAASAALQLRGTPGGAVAALQWRIQ